MSLIVYECQRAGHGHEIRQFSAAAQSLYDYFDGRDETALFIGNVNVGEANLDKSNRKHHSRRSLLVFLFPHHPYFEQ